MTPSTDRHPFSCFFFSKEGPLLIRLEASFSFLRDRVRKGGKSLKERGDRRGLIAANRLDLDANFRQLGGVKVRRGGRLTRFKNNGLVGFHFRPRNDVVRAKFKRFRDHNVTSNRCQRSPDEIKCMRINRIEIVDKTRR